MSRRNRHLKKTEETAELNSAVAQPKAPQPVGSQLKAKKFTEIKEPGSIAKLFQFFKEAKNELTRVTWPTRKETVKSTAVLLVLVAISAVYLGLVDGILSRILKLIVGVG